MARAPTWVLPVEVHLLAALRQPLPAVCIPMARVPSWAIPVEVHLLAAAHHRAPRAVYIPIEGELSWTLPMIHRLHQLPPAPIPVVRGPLWIVRALLLLRQEVLPQQAAVRLPPLPPAPIPVARGPLWIVPIVLLPRAAVLLVLPVEALPWVAVRLPPLPPAPILKVKAPIWVLLLVPIWQTWALRLLPRQVPMTRMPSRQSPSRVNPGRPGRSC